MSKERELKHLEMQVEEAHKIVDIADSLRRLHSNADFKKIILEQYFKEEPARIASLTGKLQHDEKAVGRLHNDLKAVGALQQFFSTIYQGAAQAENLLSQADGVRAEIEAEEQE